MVRRMNQARGRSRRAYPRQIIQATPPVLMVQMAMMLTRTVCSTAPPP